MEKKSIKKPSRKTKGVQSRRGGGGRSQKNRNNKNIVAEKPTTNNREYLIAFGIIVFVVILFFGEKKYSPIDNTPVNNIPANYGENVGSSSNSIYNRHITNIARKCSDTARGVESVINEGLAILRERGKPISQADFAEALDRAIPEEALGSGLKVEEAAASLVTLMAPSRR